MIHDMPAAGLPLSHKKTHSLRVAGLRIQDEYLKNGDYLRHDQVFKDEPVVRGTRKIDPFMTHQSDSAKEERKRTHNLLRSQLKQSMECRNTLQNRFNEPENYRPCLRQITSPRPTEKAANRVMRNSPWRFHTADSKPVSHSNHVDIIGHRNDQNVDSSCRYANLSHCRKPLRQRETTSSRANFLHHRMDPNIEHRKESTTRPSRIVPNHLPKTTKTEFISFNPITGQETKVVM